MKRKSDDAPNLPRCGFRSSCVRLWFGAMLALVASFSTAHGATLTVSAAASLADVLIAIGKAYEQKAGDKVSFNFGGSNLLARQIEEGAPVDLFFSADEAKMDQLERKGLLLDGTRRSLLSNSLVIVVGVESKLTLASPQELLDSRVKRVALAEPSAVPAGIYARHYLQSIDLWPKLMGKVVPAENVRAVVAAVAGGNADAGFVYRTDAAISKKVKVAYEVPARGGDPISYPAAVVKGSKEPEAARHFQLFLESDDAVKLYQKSGFTILFSPSHHEH